jgi:hypothetical protein
VLAVVLAVMLPVLDVPREVVLGVELVLADDVVEDVP